MNPASLPADLTLGYVHLTVADLDRALAFYQRSLGLKVHRREGDTAWLGAGGADLLALTGRPGATRPRRDTGLYHFALLMPSRPALARAIWNIAETRTPIQGASDHLVSEALYLSDMDGNGIELYHDRPRAEWRDAHGNLRMDTLPLDLDAILAERDSDGGTWTGLEAGASLGHMHLHVRDTRQALTFYVNVLGFDLMMDMGSALFVSAGGYHHHLGLNAWGTLNAPPPPPEAVGLRYFTVHLPASADLDAVTARARAAGAPVEEHPAGRLVRDPSHNALVLTVA